MNRRDFLQTTPALLAPPVLNPAPAHPPQTRLAAGPRPADQPLRAALIGCGWYGKHDLMRLLQVSQAVEVVGLCDVDSRHLAEAETWVRQRRPAARPRAYADHEELLAQERPDLVLIATPDHWHARQATDALAAGAHLYLQKPVANSRADCQAVLAAARRHDRRVQVALQRRSTPHLIEAKRRFVDSGLLGDVHHADAFCYFRMRDGAQREEQPVPDHFDYARWTGPAPRLPFRGLPHRRWRAFRAYGNGILGDMCVHMLDLARWCLGLGWPARVESTGGIFADRAADATTTDTQQALFHYPDHRMTFAWQHRSWGQPPRPGRTWGLDLYGTGGKLELDVWGYRWVPNGKDATAVTGTALIEKEQYPEDVDEPGIEIHQAPATRAHLRNLLDCIASGERPVADIEEGVISTGSCILAMEALGRY